LCGPRPPTSTAALQAGDVRLTLEAADQPELIALIDALDAYQKPLYPPESHHGIDIAALQARGAVRGDARRRRTGRGHRRAGARRPGLAGELKRMYLLPAWRGGGRARALLAFLEAAGGARGCGCFRLETGIHQHAALAFYAAPATRAAAPSPTTAPTRCRCSWKRRSR
jgi:putative acetyltransferase